MLTYLRPAFVMTALATVMFGLAYPLAMTGLAQVLFPSAASGSLVKAGDKVVGSALIGQSFSSDRYFWSRPSAAGDNGYDASGSSGSNLGPTSKKLIDRVQADIAKLRADGIQGPVPADAVTTSASGLDPHISPAFAALQVERVARARNVPAARVRAILDAATENRVLGLIGEPRVNVLELNLRLDADLPVRSG